MGRTGKGSNKKDGGKKDHKKKKDDLLVVDSASASVSISDDVEVNLKQAAYKVSIDQLKVELRARIPKVVSLSGCVNLREVKCHKPKKRVKCHKSGSKGGKKSSKGGRSSERSGSQERSGSGSRSQASGSERSGSY